MDAKISGLNCEYSPPKCEQRILEPVQVHVYFRHGDRSPTPIDNATMDSDIWASRVQERPQELPGRMDYKFQEFPWGQLTKKGKEQALGLGQWLRKYYLDVLRIPEDLPSSIRFRSTNYERTHLTGWYVLNGLLGSSEAAASVPLEMRGKKETLAETGQSPRVSAIVKEHMDAAMKAVKQPDGTFRPSEISILFEKMKVVTAGFLGLEPDAAFNWFTIFLALDVLNCGLEHGDPLPDSISAADFNALSRLVEKHVMTAFKDKRFMRFGMGRLMREIVEAITTRPKPSAGSTERVPSLYIYAGHDATILPLSVVLGAPAKEWPGYCSNIIIELLKSTDLSEQYFVRVLYNGKEQTLALFSSPNEAKTLLTLDEFLEQASYSVVTEEEFQTFCHEIQTASSNFYDDVQLEQVTEA